MAKSTACRASAGTALRLFRFAVAGVLILFSPVALAGGFCEVNVPGCSGKTASRSLNVDRSSLKGFISPRTGEILTYEEALEMELTGKPRTAHPGGARATARAGREIRLGRRVPLEGGGYIAEVESPLPYVKLKARISPDGATGFQCRGRAEAASFPKGGRE